VKKIVIIAAKGVKAENVLPLDDISLAAKKDIHTDNRNDDVDNENYDNYIAGLGKDISENEYFDVQPADVLKSPPNNKKVTNKFA